MSGKTKIEWAEKTWNPIRGCSRVSEGCRNCYAERQAARFCGEGQPYEGLVRSTASGPKWTGAVRLIEKDLTAPLRWRKPARIFVCSMADLFYEHVADEWLDQIFAAMALAPWHTFIITTKRPERMRDYLGVHDSTAAPLPVSRIHRLAEKASGRTLGMGWPLPNVWCGVSAEDQATADERIPILLDTLAAVRWVSAEPLLGPVDLRGGPTWHDWLRGIGVRPRMPDGEPEQFQTAPLDWVVVGGESGPGARPCNVEWIRFIVEQCRDAKIACFVKQLGGLVIDRFLDDDDDETTFWPETTKLERISIRSTRTPGGADRALLRHPKGGDPSEWPEDLRVREYPR